MRSNRFSLCANSNEVNLCQFSKGLLDSPLDSPHPLKILKAATRAASRNNQRDPVRIQT